MFSEALPNPLPSISRLTIHRNPEGEDLITNGLHQVHCHFCFHCLSPEWKWQNTIIGLECSSGQGEIEDGWERWSTSGVWKLTKMNDCTNENRPLIIKPWDAAEFSTLTLKPSSSSQLPQTPPEPPWAHIFWMHLQLLIAHIKSEVKPTFPRGGVVCGVF